ncbi:hypothetical protein C8J57DRAFT_1490331 [Mycena rebaudengoi]|nr:hypothetical protein C8J57DRAFT_1490331 [Mycena rebaudengoi]
MLSSGSSDLQSPISTATSLDEDEETAKILRNAKQSILDAIKAAESTVASLPIPDTSSVWEQLEILEENSRRESAERKPYVIKLQEWEQKLTYKERCAMILLAALSRKYHITDEFSSYSKFTLRLSYPASTPTNYLIQVLDPLAVAALFHLPSASLTNTKRKYARIRAVDTGVRTPTALPPQNAPPPATNSILVLKPLYLGVLPASLTPFLLVALPVLALAACAVPRGNAYLEGYAARAIREIRRNLKAE